MTNDEIIAKLNSKYNVDGKILDIVDGKLIVYAAMCVFSIDCKTLSVLAYRLGATVFYMDNLNE